MADEDEQTEQPGDDGGTAAMMPIVGIGVGAASFESLVELFSSLTPAVPAAYLIAVRQMDGLGVASVVEALAQGSPFPTKLAEDGERIAAHHVYVAAPDDLVTIEADHLRVRPATELFGHQGALDSLLISLAEHAQERAIAILLSELGSEGSAGVVATKKFGGLSIAEATDDADLAAQGSADPAAVADLRLPVDRIAPEIARYARNLRPILEDEERDADGGKLESHVTQVATILRNVTSHDFHGYKRGTFIRRVQRRIQVMQIEGGLEAYVERLRTDREEVQHLFQDLLIGVTQFFRDPTEFDSLQRELPRLFEKKGAGDPFRVWVLGCATGEEAYSIAILLREHLATLDHPPEVQIFATDLDARALSLARAGRYSDSIAKHVRPDRLERWFVREGDTYCVSKELREMCIFSPHNIVKDAPFSRIDILSCRNLLIYLSTELQNRVIPIFHFSLRPDGMLFLGSSENVTRHSKLFAPVDRKSRVFRRLETATRIIPDFPLSPRIRSGNPAAAQLAHVPLEGRLPASVSRQAEAVAERYSPAYVVVDAAGDVLHFSGRTGRYLEPSAGVASLSLPNLVHRDLRLDVRTALGRAIAEARRVEVPRLTVRQDHRAFAVNVIVEPLSADDVTSLAVVFQDLGPIADGDSTDTDRLTTDEHVQRLEAELRANRDRLQATIEELESTNEELKSSNEEYQSINEELQSANEEMETSKEELQSVNEELQTVNGELAHRLQDLGRVNSDLKNLLESTQIATLILDNDLRIRNFTPAATDVFHLLDTDVGRPLDHVVSRVSYPELVEDVRRVLKTLAPVERQVKDDARRHFAARVLPYRSIDNYISGAVVTFTDLTAVRNAEAALRESDARHIAMADAAPALVWEADQQGVTFVNQHFLDFFGVGFDRIKGMEWTDFIHPEDRDAYLTAYAAAFADRRPLEHDIRLLRADGEYRWTRSTGRPVGEERFVALCMDITESKEAGERLRASEERQAFLLRFSDALRTEAGADAVGARAVRLLAEELRADRCYTASLDLAGDRVDLLHQYNRGDLPAIPSFFRMSEFPEASRILFAQPVIYDDVATEPELGASSRQLLASIEFGAMLSAPIRHGDDAPFWSIAVVSRAPRRWTAAEVALIAEAGERVWAAVERARAEAALRESEKKYRTLFDSIDEGFAVVEVILDEEGKPADLLHLEANRAYEQHTGLHDIVGKRSSEIIPEGGPWLDFYGNVALTGQAARNESYLAAPIDRWIAAYAAPIDVEGSLKVVIVFNDVTERKRTEQTLRDSEQWQRALIEGIPQLVWRTADRGEWTWASPQWTEYTGQPELESHGKGWLEMLHPNDREIALATWAKAREQGGVDVEYRIRRAADDSYRWFRTRAMPLRDQDGAISEWLGTSTDVDETRSLQKRQEVLVAELQHRVRNMLTVVRSVFGRSAERSSELEHLVQHFQGRLGALARTHVVVTRRAEGTVALEDMIRDELLSVGVSDGPKLHIDGPEVELDARTAETFSLAIHELTTNALKYGALSVPAGSLSITWQLNLGEGGRPHLAVEWVEQGVPIVGVAPNRTGFGRELLEEIMPYQLAADTKLEFRGGGVRCFISVPLARPEVS